VLVHVPLWQVWPLGQHVPLQQTVEQQSVFWVQAPPLWVQQLPFWGGWPLEHRHWPP